MWQKPRLIPSAPKDFKDFIKQEYKKTIISAKKQIFEKLPLTPYFSRQLTEIAANLFVKSPPRLIASNTSGIVIAGFGTEEVFPILESYSIHGKIDNYLKYIKNEEKCAEIDLKTNAVIRSFAQSEMVLTFMTGVDPNYDIVIDRVMEKTCVAYPKVLLDHIDSLDNDEKEKLKIDLEKIGKNMYDTYRDELTKYRQDNYIDPVMRVVQALPKDELAAMAETLISLTSFKRRVSMEQETVADPIDVAVISKGDGFIWIKRKHYFERELNQHFFANYYKEEVTNGTKTGEKAD